MILGSYHRKTNSQNDRNIDYVNSDITESPIVMEELVHSSENNRDDYNSSINNGKAIETNHNDHAN